MDEPDPNDVEVEESPQEKTERKVVRNAIDLQRIKLEKLMKNPEKPIIIPETPKEKDFIYSVPTFVRNVMGSSAGAGSGEFHVYRNLRRKEYARQKMIEVKGYKESLDQQYRDKIEKNRLDAEAKTAKKRAKRLKKKQNQKTNKKFKRTTETVQNDLDILSCESDNSSDNDENLGTTNKMDTENVLRENNDENPGSESKMNTEDDLSENKTSEKHLREIVCTENEEHLVPGSNHFEEREGSFKKDLQNIVPNNETEKVNESKESKDEIIVLSKRLEKLSEENKIFEKEQCEVPSDVILENDKQSLTDVEKNETSAEVAISEEHMLTS